MIIGYIYIMNDGTRHDVHMKAALNKYIKQTEEALKNEDQVKVRFNINKKQKIEYATN